MRRSSRAEVPRLTNSRAKSGGWRLEAGGGGGEEKGRLGVWGSWVSTVLCSGVWVLGLYCRLVTSVGTVLHLGGGGRLPQTRTASPQDQFTDAPFASSEFAIVQRVTYNSTAVFTSAHDREREVGPLNKVATMRAFSQPLAMATMLLVGAFASSPVLAEYAIPEQDDWVEQGVALTAGSEGTWDVRFYGQISPGTVLKKDGTYFLYYVGADGDRSTD